MKDQLQHYLKKHISPPGQKRAQDEKKIPQGKDTMRCVPKRPEFNPSETNEKSYF
jgi:hypothetical protein